MTLSRIFQPAKRQFLSAVASFDSADIPVGILIFGLVLIGYGASQLHHGVGPLVVGALAVLYVRPLLGWIKK